MALSKAAMTKFLEWETPLSLRRKRKELEGLSLEELREIEFESLGRFKEAGSFPHGYSGEYLSFYAPRDPGVHMVLLWALLQARSSVAINMYGFDDPQMVSLLRYHALNEKMLLTLTLDSSQAKTGVEPALLELLRNDLDGNSIAIVARRSRPSATTS